MCLLANTVANGHTAPLSGTLTPAMRSVTLNLANFSEVTK